MNDEDRPFRSARFSARRRLVAGFALGFGLAGIAGCGADAPGPDRGAVSIEDLQGLEDRVADLQDRVEVLEEGAPSDGEEGAPSDGGATDGEAPGRSSTGADDVSAFLADSQSLLGEQVTVSAELTELIATTDVGAAFRIAGESGDPISVVSATPAPALSAGDRVRVSGTVLEIQPDIFEADFGVAPDALFEDADAWFAEAEGQIAISASEIEVVQGQPDE